MPGLGVTLALEKEEGPCTTMTLLGMVIDTEKGEPRLPEDKLKKLLEMVAEWIKQEIVYSQGA